MRPKIICHMVSSIDGRLLVERWTPPATGSADALLEHYEQIATRLQADGWIVGRETMAHYADSPVQTGRSSADTGLCRSRRSHIADRHGRSVAVAVDRHGRLHYGRDNTNGDHYVAILGEQVSDDYLAELREDGVSYLFAGPDGNDLHPAMDVLGRDFGISTILLEGGGKINGAFLKADLIDEISLLVYPGIDGLSGIPGIFEYIGGGDKPAAGRSLRHFHTETLDGGVVWLRYLIVRHHAVLTGGAPETAASPGL